MRDVIPFLIGACTISVPIVYRPSASLGDPNNVNVGKEGAALLSVKFIKPVGALHPLFIQTLESGPRAQSRGFSLNDKTY